MGKESNGETEPFPYYYVGDLVCGWTEERAMGEEVHGQLGTWAIWPVGNEDV